RGARLLRAEAVGLHEEKLARPEDARGDDGATRRFVRHDEPAPPRLLLTARPAAAVVAQDAERCDDVWLASYVEPGRPLVHHLRFVAWNWRARGLPLLLPPGARVVAAQADGHWLAGVPQQEAPQGTHVLLPVPNGAPSYGERQRPRDVHVMEVVYETGSAE